AQHPLHTEAPNDRTKRLDRPLELALFDGDRDHLVREWGMAAMSDERAQEREAVLPTGHADRDAVPGLQHGEAPQRLADGRLHAPLDVLGFHWHRSPQARRARSISSGVYRNARKTQLLRPGRPASTAKCGFTYSHTTWPSGVTSKILPSHPSQISVLP